MTSSVSVVIPAYKKTAQLVRNLRHNLPYLKGTQVIVVNDDPTRSIRDTFKEFDEVDLLEQPVNGGFAAAVNAGIRASNGRYVLLLNSDVRLLDRSWERSLKHFASDKGLFAVSFAQREKDGRVVGRNRLVLWKGMVHHAASEHLRSGDTAWAEGGAAIFRRDLLLRLESFDTIYSPFYWEDIDLSYRAWKQGYRIHFDADTLVEHHHESTIGTYFSRRKIASVAYRNQLVFHWSCLSGPLLWEHLLHLPFWFIRMTLRREWAFIQGLFNALTLLPEIISKRSRDAEASPVSDRAIINNLSTL